MPLRPLIVWRVRFGAYRVLYEIHDDWLVVLVIRIAKPFVFCYSTLAGAKEDHALKKEPNNALTLLAKNQISDERETTFRRLFRRYPGFLVESRFSRIDEYSVESLRRKEGARCGLRDGALGALFGSPTSARLCANRHRS